MKTKAKISIFLGLVLLLPILGSCRRATIRVPRDTMHMWVDDEQEAEEISRPAEVLSITDPQEARRVEEYFGPLPELGHRREIFHKPVKALYIAAGRNLEGVTSLIRETEVNAVVVDFKESWGLSYPSQTRFVNELGMQTGTLDMKATVDELKEAGAYVIARITCFKDSELPDLKPEWAIRNSDGELLYWGLEDGLAWLSPYNTEVWDFLVTTALEAVDLGVDEIQFDYVRFPSGVAIGDEQPYYGSGYVPSRIQAINRFLEYARVRISDERGIPITADVFPSMILSSLDANILGQEWTSMGLTGITAICPMIYPSHFANVGQNGLGSEINGVLFPAPDKEPYEVVTQTLLAAEERLNRELSLQQQQEFSYIRPYYQAFNGHGIAGAAYAMEYDAQTIRKQMQAGYDRGYNEWILWNASGEYDPDIFDPAPTPPPEE